MAEGSKRIANSSLPASIFGGFVLSVRELRHVKFQSSPHQDTGSEARTHVHVDSYSLRQKEWIGGPRH